MSIGTRRSRILNSTRPTQMPGHLLNPVSAMHVAICTASDIVNAEGQGRFPREHTAPFRTSFSAMDLEFQLEMLLSAGLIDWFDWLIVCISRPIAAKLAASGFYVVFGMLGEAQISMSWFEEPYWDAGRETLLSRREEKMHLFLTNCKRGGKAVSVTVLHPQVVSPLHVASEIPSRLMFFVMGFCCWWVWKSLVSVRWFWNCTVQAQVCKLGEPF